MVLKPAELTPLTAIALAGLAERAGLPDGVLNLVLGDAAAIGGQGAGAGAGGGEGEGEEVRAGEGRGRNSQPLLQHASGLGRKSCPRTLNTPLVPTHPPTHPPTRPPTHPPAHPPTGHELVHSDTVRKIGFTGSTAVSGRG